jgi:hypothetical protein
MNKRWLTLGVLAPALLLLTSCELYADATWTTYASHPWPPSEEQRCKITFAWDLQNLPPGITEFDIPYLEDHMWHQLNAAGITAVSMGTISHGQLDDIPADDDDSTPYDDDPDPDKDFIRNINWGGLNSAWSNLDIVISFTEDVPHGYAVSMFDIDQTPFLDDHWDINEAWIGIGVPTNPETEMTYNEVLRKLVHEAGHAFLNLPHGPSQPGYVMAQGGTTTSFHQDELDAAHDNNGC